MELRIFAPSSLTQTLIRVGTNFFRSTKPKSPPVVILNETPALSRALQTIRMAANAGEDYEIVAARIDKEAADYEEFLNNPLRIGRISLNVKHFGPMPADTAHVREQCRINQPSEGHPDPAEGRASVWYTFNRSNNKVLEFIVHDEHDNPLFPIARTYTSWIGTKEFDLGLGRTFYLSLFEGAPGYVNVRAGFMEPNELENAIYDAFNQQDQNRSRPVSGRPETVSSLHPVLKQSYEQKSAGATVFVLLVAACMILAKSVVNLVSSP